jgi:staphylococcal nuclease domain-containing protein 1
MVVKTVKIGYATGASGQDSPQDRKTSGSAPPASLTHADLPEPFPSPRIPALGKKRLPNVPPARYIGSMRHQAKVKSVMSGDTLILSSIENPDRERTLSLAYCTSPHLKKEGDEPFAFESRDALRKLVVGKNVQFLVLYQIPNTKREYGIVYMNDGRQLPEEMIKEGWLKLREDAGRKEDSDEALQQLDKLRLLEATARSEDKGLWAPSGGRIELQHDMGNTQAFLDSYKGKTVDGLIERVLSGDRMLVRLMVTPTKHVQGMEPHISADLAAHR